MVARRAVPVTTKEVTGIDGNAKFPRPLKNTLSSF